MDVKGTIFELMMADTDENGCMCITREARESIIDKLIELYKKASKVKPEKKAINLNDWVKVKLTERGKDIYRRDRTEVANIVKTGNVQIEPNIDDEGFTKFQLWHFIEIFGKYIGMCEDAVIMPLEIVPVDDKQGR